MVPVSAKKVLVAPLDWGLGHATRCIPIINALLKRGNTVVIAATGARKAMLAEAFPGIRIVHLPEYDVRLSGSTHLINWGIFLQVPRLWSVIRKENKWLNDFCREESVDLVISDNRYGLYHKKLHCVFITHQLFIYSGLGTRIDRWLMQIHFRLIGRFTECWVPDNAEPEKSIAGRLSHPPQAPPFPITYLGLLSRFSGTGPTNGQGYPNTGLLILLSGPEPQRSLAEQIFVRELQTSGVRALLVRGLPGKAAAALPVPAARGETSSLRVVNHLPPAELQSAISTAERIICRSGYSTLMDLIALRRTALLIPTPGQPEQEYLATYMAEKGWMTRQQQDSFSLAALDNGTAPTEDFAADLFFNGELPALTLR